MFTAIYVDPRFMCTLTAAKKQKAIDHLIKTWTLKESISGVSKYSSFIIRGQIHMLLNLTIRFKPSYTI